MVDLAAELEAWGPLAPLFEDPTIEEIWWNEPQRVFIARSGLPELTTIVMTSAAVELLVERMLRPSGRRLDRSMPFVDATLSDGSRLHVAIPPITRVHWSVNIRRYVMRARSLDDLVSADVMDTDQATWLRSAVRGGKSIVVAGATQAGKTTLLQALLQELPPQERIVSCEEVLEIQVGHPDWVAMQTRNAGLDGGGEVTLRTLVRESLRMRPTRLVVGEVRQSEALDLLIASNSGIPTLSTLHANSAREALVKLAALPLLAGPNISPGFVASTIATCVDCVVHVRMDSGGRRRITEIRTTTGRVLEGEAESEPLALGRAYPVAV